MPATRQHDSGPAGAYAPSYPTGAGASGFSTAPPRYTPHKSKSNRVVTNHTTSSTYIEERRPLISQPKLNPGAETSRFALLAVLFVIFFLCPLVYFIFPRPSDTVNYKPLYESAQATIHRLTANNVALGNDVTLYKHMYEDVSVRAEHLEHENAAFEGEIHDLQTELHDLRGQLTNSKVLAFWEMARIMQTNMYVPLSPLLTQLMGHLRGVWVSADDSGNEPKFWSYGVTNGLFNDNDPPVSSIKHYFAAYHGAIVESTELRRIVGYKIESNRWNNGWWLATGLDEFGQGGSHVVKFAAKPGGNGAEYEVTVFYADWKL